LSKQVTRSSKRTALTLLSLGAIAAIAFMQFDWLTLSMHPNGKSVVLGTLSGNEIFATSGALTTFASVCVLLILLLRGWLVSAAFVTLGAVATTLSAGLAVSGLLTGKFTDSSGKLATWVNIAAAHDIEDLDRSWSLNGYLFVAACLVFLIGATISLATVKTWPSRRTKTVGSESTSLQGPSDEQDVNDSISMWDSQRQK
jgi:hypothetical protein